MTKVIIPIVSGLPPGHNYRVILIERDYDEILASQATMIERRGGSINKNPECRDRLRREYARQVAEAKSLLSARSDLTIVSVRHEDVIRNPDATARMLNQFAGGGLDLASMSMAVDRTLHRTKGDVGLFQKSRVPLARR